jgi:hypothetical protein
VDAGIPQKAHSDNNLEHFFRHARGRKNALVIHIQPCGNEHRPVKLIAPPEARKVSLLA